MNPMSPLVIMNDEFIVSRKSTSEKDDGFLGADSVVGVSLRSVPSFLLQHSTIRDVHPDFECIVGERSCKKGDNSRKRPRSMPQLDVTNLDCQQFQSCKAQPLQTEASLPILTGPNTQVSVHCSTEPNDFLVVFHKRGCAIQRLLVSNCAGFWAADFCGMGAYQQLLLLPIDEGTAHDELSKVSSDGLLLSSLLRRSLFTDGGEVWLPATVHVDRPCERTTDSVLADSYSEHSRVRLPDPSMMNVAEIPIVCVSPPTEGDSSLNAEDIRDAWVGTMEKGLQMRLQEQRTLLVNEQSRIRQHKHVVNQSRSILRELSCTPRQVSLYIVKLKYLAQPNLPTPFQPGISVSVLMELDLIHDCPNETDTLKDVHVNVLTAEPNKGCTVKKVSTLSGLIPNLQSKQLTTVMLLAELTGVELDGNDVHQLSHAGVNLVVQSMWRDASDSSASRRGAILASFTLPYQALLLHSKRPSTIDFDSQVTLNLNQHPLGAIYDCRRPHLVDIDVSLCRLDRLAWMQRLQETLSGSFLRVDQVHQETPSTSIISLALYAFPSTAINGLVHLVKNSLPDNAIIVPTALVLP